MTSQTVQSRVLFRLVQAEGRPVLYGDLAWAAWPEGRADSWLNSLRVAVASLRADGYDIRCDRKMGYRLPRRALGGRLPLRIHMVA